MQRCLGVSIVLVLLLSTPALAQDRTSEIDDIFRWVTPGLPGCAVAASHHGKLVVNRAYGLADLERNVPIGPDTRFDVASIRKQFIAAAVLLLVEDGRLSLSDDVRTHIPELPDYGRTVTLDHLLTHTSGLRDWIPLQEWSGGSEDAMTLILRQRTLNFAPGEEWSYSNSGYVLLVEVVARASRMPFSEFARTRLFEPLGMKSTLYEEDTNGVIRNRALAYEPEKDRWRIAMRLGDERGCGAVFSTASDLVLWTDALASQRLGTFVSQKLEEPARLSNGRTLAYGRGLQLGSNFAGRMLWHGGGAAGYRSILARYPDQGLSVAVLCNAGERSDGRDGFAARVHDLFVSVSRPAPAAPAPAPVVEGLDVKSKAGLFFKEGSGEWVRLGVNNGRLAIQGGGPLVAVTPDRFRIPRANLAFMSQDEFELRFLSADRFELRSMEGQTTGYRRAVAWAPTAEELQARAGRYESDELRGVFQMTPGKGTLMARYNEGTGGGVELRSVDHDVFQAGALTLRFRRDNAGRVLGLDFATPVLRNITFTRRD